MNPLISVIIPVYNCEKTIESAIISILNQTYKNIEIIVANDNSTDGTKNILERLAKTNQKLKIVDVPDDLYRFDQKTKRNINAGYSARNEAFKYAKGEYITFQDADDVSLINRIEVQYELLKKYNATHITTDWIQLNKNYDGKKLDVVKYISLNKNIVINPEEICALAKKTKGLIPSISEKLNSLISFSVKRQKFLNKIFWGSLESYPGIPGIPLFKREVIDRVKFCKRDERMWPSFTGRGADRDFSFRVAEKFKNSYVFLIPLYMWNVSKQNPRYEGKNINEFI